MLLLRSCLVALLLGACSALTLPAVGATSVAPTSPGTGLSGEQAEAHQLEQQIASQTEQEQIAGERYDQDNVTLAVAQAKVAKIRSALKKDAAEISVAKNKVRTTAVLTYVYGSSQDEQIGGILTGGLDKAGELSTYAGVATNELSRAIDQLRGAQSQLQQSESAETAAASSAASALSTASRSRDEAANLAAQAQHTLGEVKGQIAAVIAAQEAAAAKAAAERAARAQEAQQREAAAAAAAQAASVAAAIAGDDPSAATQAAAASAASSANSTTPTGAQTVTPAGTSPAGDLAVATAEDYLGVPYLWGGASKAGVDCSGLTMLSWAAAGVSLTHSAWYQYKESTRISLDQLEPGDLLFYYFADDGSDPVTHVAMYVGAGPYGTQTVIQAPESGETVSYAAIYFYGFVGAGRPAGASTTPAPPTGTTTTTTTTTTTSTTTTIVPASTTVPASSTTLG